MLKKMISSLSPQKRIIWAIVVSGLFSAFYLGLLYFFLLLASLTAFGGGSSWSMLVSFLWILGIIFVGLFFEPKILKKFQIVDKWKLVWWTIGPVVTIVSVFVIFENMSTFVDDVKKRNFVAENPKIEILSIVPVEYSYLDHLSGVTFRVRVLSDNHGEMRIVGKLSDRRLNNGMTSLSTRILEQTQRVEVRAGASGSFDFTILAPELESETVKLDSFDTLEISADYYLRDGQPVDNLFDTGKSIFAVIPKDPKSDPRRSSILYSVDLSKLKSK